MIVGSVPLRAVEASLHRPSAIDLRHQVLRVFRYGELDPDETDPTSQGGNINL